MPAAIQPSHTEARPTLRTLGGRYLVAMHITLGSGKFGSVHLGRDQQTGDLVAVKIERGRSDWDAPSVEHEHKMYRPLSSSDRAGKYVSTVRYYDRRGRQGLLVLPYAPVTLGALIESPLLNSTERLPEVLLLHMARELLNAVAAIHSENIVHADLKPGNILLSQQGTVVLADFGVAGRGKIRAEVGTPYYHSHRVGDTECVDHLDDWWALGLVLLDLFVPYDVLEYITDAQWSETKALLAHGRHAPLLSAIPEPALQCVAARFFALWAEAVDNSGNFRVHCLLADICRKIGDRDTEVSQHVDRLVQDVVEPKLSRDMYRMEKAFVQTRAEDMFAFDWVYDVDAPALPTPPVEQEVWGGEDWGVYDADAEDVADRDCIGETIPAVASDNGDITGGGECVQSTITVDSNINSDSVDDTVMPGDGNCSTDEGFSSDEGINSASLADSNESLLATDSNDRIAQHEGRCTARVSRQDGDNDVTAETAAPVHATAQYAAVTVSSHTFRASVCTVDAATQTDVSTWQAPPAQHRPAMAPVGLAQLLCCSSDGTSKSAPGARIVVRHQLLIHKQEMRMTSSTLHSSSSANDALVDTTLPPPATTTVNTAADDGAFEDDGSDYTAADMHTTPTLDSILLRMARRAFDWLTSLVGMLMRRLPIHRPAPLPTFH
ncbi:serine/threonine protein kinase [Sorochytrium milnesiophthora]